MKIQKALLAIILLVVAIGGGFVAWKHYMKAPTAYTNTTYGFSISNPDIAAYAVSEIELGFGGAHTVQFKQGSDEFGVIAWPIEWWQQNATGEAVGERPAIKGPDGIVTNDGGRYLGKNNRYAFTQSESSSLNPDTQAFNAKIPALMATFSAFNL